MIQSVETEILQFLQRHTVPPRLRITVSTTAKENRSVSRFLDFQALQWTFRRFGSQGRELNFRITLSNKFLTLLCSSCTRKTLTGKEECCACQALVTRFCNISDHQRSSTVNDTLARFLFAKASETKVLSISVFDATSFSSLIERKMSNEIVFSMNTIIS